MNEFEQYLIITALFFIAAGVNKDIFPVRLIMAALSGMCLGRVLFLFIVGLFA